MVLLGGGLPPTEEKYAYSCNVWYSVALSSALFGTQVRRAWFALTFNPIENVDSSNPCAIYVEMSNAVQQGDVGSRMLANYKSQLINIVDDLVAKQQISVRDAKQLRQDISTEGIASFRPEIWRLDLEKISQRKYGFIDVDRLKLECKQIADQLIQGNPPQVLQPNEYLILDLQDDEYETVIVG